MTMRRGCFTSCFPFGLAGVSPAHLPSPWAWIPFLHTRKSPPRTFPMHLCSPIDQAMSRPALLPGLPGVEVREKQKHQAAASHASIISSFLHNRKSRDWHMNFLQKETCCSESDSHAMARILPGAHYDHKQSEP